MRIGKNLGKYLKTGLGAATLIGGMAACERTILDSTYRGEGYLSGVKNENGYQLLEVDIRRNAGDSFEPPPLILPSPTEAPIHLVLASKKPIDAQAGDRLNFRYKHDKNRSEFEKSISGWTKPKWCQVYPRR